MAWTVSEALVMAGPRSGGIENNILDGVAAAEQRKDREVLRRDRVSLSQASCQASSSGARGGKLSGVATNLESEGLSRKVWKGPISQKAPQGEKAPEAPLFGAA